MRWRRARGSTCPHCGFAKVVMPTDAGGARLADGTLVEVANYPGCAARSGFAGAARFGYAKSQHRYVYGLRLVLLSDRRGLPLGYTLVAANEKEYEPLADLLTGTEPGLLLADKGLWRLSGSPDPPP